MNDKLFDEADKLIKHINSNQSSNGKKFILYRNDIMHIKYRGGGYFKSHEDYLNVNSNFLEEYSLIICINGSGSVNGNSGRTILKLNDFFTVKSTASCTKGMSLLFRKDIEHEGEELAPNTVKEILTFNVWAIDPEIKQIVRVHFENDRRTILIAANRIRDHPVNNNLLSSFLSSNVGGLKTDVVVDYNSKHSYEEFQIIEKIYNGHIISYEDLTNNQEIIDYYCFNYKDLLIKKISESSTVNSSSNMITNPAFVISGDEKSYLEFLNHVKKNLLPFVPFKVIMAEGTLSYGGGLTGNSDSASVLLTEILITNF